MTSSSLWATVLLSPKVFLAVFRNNFKICVCLLNCKWFKTPKSRVWLRLGLGLGLGLGFRVEEVSVGLQRNVA